MWRFNKNREKALSSKILSQSCKKKSNNFSQTHQPRKIRCEKFNIYKKYRIVYIVHIRLYKNYRKKSICCSKKMIDFNRASINSGKD